MTGSPRWPVHKAWNLTSSRRSQRRVSERSTGHRHWQPLHPRPVTQFNAHLGALLSRKKLDLTVKLRSEDEHQIRLFLHDQPAALPLWLRLTVNEHPCWLGVSERLLDNWLPGVGCLRIGQLPTGHSQAIFEKIFATLRAALPGQLIANLQFKSALSLPPVEQPAGSITFWCGTEHGGGIGCLALSEALLVTVLTDLETLPDTEPSWWEDLRVAGRLRIEHVAVEDPALASLQKDDLWILGTDARKTSADWVIDLPGGCELPATVDFENGHITVDREQLRGSTPPDHSVLTIDSGPIAVRLGGRNSSCVLPASRVLGLTLSRAGQKIATGRWVELDGRALVQIEQVLSPPQKAPGRHPKA